MYITWLWSDIIAFYCILFLSIQHIAATQNKLFDFDFDLKVPIYTACKQRHTGVNNLPRVTEWRLKGAGIEPAISDRNSKHSENCQRKSSIGHIFPGSWWKVCCIFTMGLWWRDPEIQAKYQQYYTSTSTEQCFDTVGCTSGKASILLWSAGMVICLEQGANDLHIVQQMPLPSHHLLLH